MADKHEVNIKEQNEAVLSNREKEFIKKLKGKVEQDKSDIARWERKAAIAIYQRLGIKRFSNAPYPGAPDIPLPETE